jgi:hypothetical protein
MKKNITIAVAVAILTIAALAINRSNSEVAISTTPPADTFTVTERFSGIINGKNIIFEHSDYTKYRLTDNGVVTLGDLNTERGFGVDENATVYVLDWKKPEQEQIYFVRLTGTTTLQQLGSNREVILNALLEKK